MPENHMESCYNSKNPLIKWLYKRQLDMILNEIPNKKIRLLDACCGEGQLLERISKERKKIKLFGSDITLVALKKAKERVPNAVFVLEDILKTNYPDEYFDVITCIASIEHIPDYKFAFLEFERVLKEGGILIIVFPNEYLWRFCRLLLLRFPIKIPDHYWAFSVKMIKDATFLDLKKKIFIPLKFNYISLLRMMVFKKW